jgi:hypothetical protein
MKLRVWRILSLENLQLPLYTCQLCRFWKLLEKNSASAERQSKDLFGFSTVAFMWALFDWSCKCLWWTTFHQSFAWSRRIKALGSIICRNSHVLLCGYLQLNVIWLDVVTYLHHHGYDKKVPWYRGMVCTFHLNQGIMLWYLSQIEKESNTSDVGV